MASDPILHHLATMKSVIRGSNFCLLIKAKLGAKIALYSLIYCRRLLLNRALHSPLSVHIIAYDFAPPIQANRPGTTQQKSDFSDDDRSGNE